VIHLFRQYFSIRKAIFIFGEAVLIYCAVTLASLFLIEENIWVSDLLETAWWKILLITVVAQLSLYFDDLYEVQPVGNTVELAIRLIQSIGITSVVLAVIYLLWEEAMIGQWIFFVSIIFLIFFFASWRFLYAYAVKKKFLTEKAVIVGDGELARDLVEEIRGRGDITYDVRLLIGQERGDCSRRELQGIPIRYGFDDLCDLAEKEQASSIIVALDQKRGVMPFKELLNCKVKGFSIIDGESFYERITGKVLVEKINPSWLIFSDGFVKSPVAKYVKRLVGLFLSLIMLIPLSPLLVIVAIAIKLNSKGPVLFS
jgi:FlaA1/EpsC-like NDP-sugar epimerase